MRNFVHVPLKEPDQESKMYEIRILNLYHGQSDDEIRISITTQAVKEGLSHADIPEEARWEALSYTWGSKLQLQCEIHVETGTEAATFVVFENLYHALVQLRHPDKDRRLWIDAICIDQSDTEESRKEKSWQIPIMHEIYSLAVRTIIWLGEAYDDSDYAITFLQELGQTFVFDTVTSETRVYARQATKRVLDLENGGRDGMAWESQEHRSVCSLFARDWFSRVWIRQEVFAASNSSIVLCGACSLQLVDFRNAVHFLAIRGLDVRSPKHATELTHFKRVVTVCQKDYANIPTVMDQIRIGECSVPQDKIYGCLGILKIMLGSAFVSKIPTHYPPTVDLFKEFFLQYIRQYGTIRLLSGAGLCQRSLLGGPTWVPDWLTDFARLDFSGECAASHSMFAEAQYLDPNVLHIKACVAIEVARVDTLRLVENLSSDKFEEAYAELSRFMQAHLQPDDPFQMHAFVKALCSPLTSLQVPTERLENMLKDMEEFARATMDPEKFSHGLSGRLLDPKHLYNYQTCIRHFMQQSVPFIFSDDGHVGVGAHQSEPGDLVAAVLGSTHLFQLRPMLTSPSESRTYHQLVGSCYMHGYNWGEALLGPLPPGVTADLRPSPDGGAHFTYYVDKLTGDVDFWDPRIDWSVLTSAQNESAPTINPPPGQPRRKVPTAAYFRIHHGTKIDDIFLV